MRHANRIPALYGILLGILAFTLFSLGISLWNVWYHPMDLTFWKSIGIHLLIAWFGGLAAAKKSTSLGWLHGLWSGFGYLMLIALLRWICIQNGFFKSDFAFLILGILASATIGGVMGRNRSNEHHHSLI